MAGWMDSALCVCGCVVMTSALYVSVAVCVAVKANGSNTSGLYRFKLCDSRYVFVQTKSKLFNNPSNGEPEFIMSTHCIVRSVSSMHCIVRSASCQCQLYRALSSFVLLPETSRDVICVVVCAGSATPTRS